MEHGPPPLFNQGVSARSRLAFFSFLAVTLIVIDARVDALRVIRIGVGVMLYPLQQTLLAPRNAVLAIGRYVTTVGSLSRDNERMQREHSENAVRLQQYEQLERENAQLRRLTGLRERVGVQSQLVQVLYESRDRFSHKLVLDRGTADGLKPGSPVIDGQGVVGQLTRVFPSICEVTLLTDKDQSIPVMIARNGLRSVAFGGSETNTLELRFLAANADVVSGDAVVTSGLDGLYPPGLPVGTILRVERDVKDQFAHVVLRPAGGIDNDRVLVVLKVDAQALPPPPPRQEPRPDQDKPAARRGAKK
jgi:rod shape-determining protein MreC